MDEPRDKLKIGSIFLFNYHDFRGIYVFTGSQETLGSWTYDFDAVLTTPDCDTDINLGWDQVQKYGKLLYAPVTL